MNNRIAIMAVAALLTGACYGHDVVTTKLTWSKEVSRVVYARCAGCHRPEGKAFSLLKYEEARPWAKAISEEVLRRRMPPWNAVKGFGNIAHDAGLSEEEIHIIADWVDGGAPEGDPNLLPTAPRPTEAQPRLRGTRIPFSGTFRVTTKLNLVGLELGNIPQGASFKLIAESPDGVRTPLIWIEGFSKQASPSYSFLQPVSISPGTRILAYPAAGIHLKLVTSSSPAR